MEAGIFHSLDRKSSSNSGGGGGGGGSGHSAAAVHGGGGGGGWLSISNLDLGFGVAINQSVDN